MVRLSTASSLTNWPSASASTMVNAVWKNATVCAAWLTVFTATLLADRRQLVDESLRHKMTAAGFQCGFLEAAEREDLVHGVRIARAGNASPLLQRRPGSRRPGKLAVAGIETFPAVHGSDDSPTTHGLTGQ